MHYRTISMDTHPTLLSLEEYDVWHVQNNMVAEGSDSDVETQVGWTATTRRWDMRIGVCMGIYGQGEVSNITVATSVDDEFSENHTFVFDTRSLPDVIYIWASDPLV
jgi:hypothetical protein